jgi:hypothetical protein
MDGSLADARRGPFRMIGVVICRGKIRPPTTFQPWTARSPSRSNPGGPVDPMAPLRAQQLGSKATHLAWRSIIVHVPPDTWKNGGLTSILG